MGRLLALTALLLTLAVPADAAIVGWGKNDSGQLGTGYSGIRPVLSPETSLLPPTGDQPVTGDGFSFQRQSDGTVLSWGADYSDTLGMPPKVNRAVPLPIPTLTHVRQVVTGGEHSLAILEDGEVQTWGAYLFGDGMGYSAQGVEAKVHLIPLPVIIPGLRAASAASDGGNVLTITPDGRVLCSGEAPVCGGVERTLPTELPSLRGAVEVKAGGVSSLGGHGIARFPDGSVKAWGADQYGQDGNGTLEVETATPVTVPGVTAKEVVAGPWGDYVLTPSGDVLAWGQDGEDQLGVKPGAAVCGRGRKRPCSTRPVTILHGASAIGAGYASGYALVGGRIEDWGRNEDGELGNGTRTPQPTPVLASVLGVSSMSVGPHFVLASIAGAGPPPALEVTPGVGSLTLMWRSKAGTLPWLIQYRPVTKPQSPWARAAKLAPAARTFTITGLTAGKTYQVTVEGTGGSHGVTGVPR